LVAGTGVEPATSGLFFGTSPENHLAVPEKICVRVAHLVFSTAAESTSSLYHPPDALGVLSQRATLVGLITKSGKPTLATKANKNSTRWVLFFVWLRGQESNLRPPGYFSGQVPKTTLRCPKKSAFAWLTWFFRPLRKALPRCIIHRMRSECFPNEPRSSVS